MAAYADPSMPSLVNGNPGYPYQGGPSAPYTGAPYPYPIQLTGAQPAWPAGSTAGMDVWPGQAPAGQAYMSPHQQNAAFGEGFNRQPELVAPVPQPWNAMQRPPSANPYYDPAAVPPVTVDYTAAPAGLSPPRRYAGTPYPTGNYDASTYEPSTGSSAFNSSVQLYRDASTRSSPVISRSMALSPSVYTSSRPKHHARAASEALQLSGRWYDRPGNWRPDFNMPRSGLSAFFPSLKRGKSLSKTLSDAAPNLALDPYIRSSLLPLSGPPVVYDLRDELARINIRELKRPVTTYDLSRFATEPPVPFMRLYHPHLPWYIDVNPRDPLGVTLHDLFSTIHDTLHSRITSSDFYNNDVTEDERTRVTEAWKYRCRNRASALNKGVLRVDFLLRECIFVGLAKGKDGMWEMRTRSL
ncbi:hypothetical protein DENSPDRAFT_841724 [Dentipellis sp. KUC8613]|nr:hypothetical protein DENSPDRAFT_841724 [Dentipellis sp. KUC8613]